MYKFETLICYKSFILTLIFFNICTMEQDAHIDENTEKLGQLANMMEHAQNEFQAFAIKCKRTRRMRYREKEERLEQKENVKSKSNKSTSKSIKKIVTEAYPAYEMSTLGKNDFDEQDGPINEDKGEIEEPREVPVEDDVMDEQNEFAATGNYVEDDEEERLCESAPIPNFIRNATWNGSCLLCGPLAPFIYKKCLNMQKRK